MPLLRPRRRSGGEFPLHLSWTSWSFLITARPCLVFVQEDAMRRTFLTTIICLALITAAHAQTMTNAGSDPLSVPTSTLPSSSSARTSAGGSTSSPAGAAVNGSVATGSSVGSSSAIGAPGSRNPQAPLQLSGEAPNNLTQAPSTTAAAAPSAPSTICPPSIPTTDGGSANITVIDGFSPGRC